VTVASPWNAREPVVANAIAPCAVDLAIAFAAKRSRADADARHPLVAETIASIGYPAMSKAVVSVGIGDVPA
jgi:hypothetical protein